MGGRKKSKTTATPSLSLQNTVTASAVALLIDGENVKAPDMIAHILDEANKMGNVVIRQVYGNWAAPSMHPWKEMMTRYALEQMGNVLAKAGRNATDIALVIGAMDLLYRGVRQFCLVAGDSDYLPLVLRLRQEECTVLGIGMPNASQALQEACNRFLTTEELMPQTASSKSIMPSLPPTRSLKDLSTSLINAYCQVKKKDGNEWVLLSALGNALKDCTPNFQDAHEKKKPKLSALIEQHADIFEVRQPKAGKDQPTEVRLREQKR